LDNGASFAWQTPLFVNCFSLIILFIFLSDNHQKNRCIKTQRYVIFQYMVIANMLLLITDSINWIVVGRVDPSMRMTQIIATTLFYALDPLPSYFFIRFTDVVLEIPMEKQKRLAHWYMLPVGLHIIMALLTPFTGWFFRITDINTYQRGDLLPLSFILSFLLMFIAAIKVMVHFTKAHRKNNERAKNIRQYRWLLKFTIIPLIGGVVQCFFYNVTYVWNITVIALMVLYVNNQNTEITTDTLTGIYNRRQAFAYFERFVRETGKSENGTAVVVLDIDNFKCINDQYGHIMGDEAIIAVARALETEFQWDDFICRFGGDEFMVITKHGAKAELKSSIERLNALLQNQHDSGRLPFSLSVSAGFAIVSQKNQTLDSLFQQADIMMFKQKAMLMRRASDKQNID